MRRILAALCIVSCLGPAPALAAKADQPPAEAAPRSANQPAPALADVLEYIRLFGYRDMLRNEADHQLDAVVELMRQTKPDVDPGVLETIHQELRVELLASSDTAVQEMAKVFQRNFTREDVAYLIGVGRDPRMQRVIALQPLLAKELEGIGERLAEEITAKAAPRIQERLRQLEGGQQL